MGTHRFIDIRQMA